MQDRALAPDAEELLLENKYLPRAIEEAIAVIVKYYSRSARTRDAL